MIDPVIKADNLKKCFYIGDNIVEALKGVSFEISRGEFVVIYGPSGCGKSTLLSLLAGLDKPSEGIVSVRGTDIYQLKQTELARYRRTKIGMVFQQFNLIPTLPAIDNVALPLVLSGVGRKEAYNRAKEMLEIVGLKDRARHKPTELSGGQQQRIAIARALVANPWILLVDEPTGNLDLPTGREILSILESVNKKWGRTVILVTHNPDFLSYGDRVLLMADGQIVKEEKKGQDKKVAEDDDKQSKIKYYIAKKSGSMSIWETMRLSRIHFLSKRLRTFLTTLGVALGVGSIVTLVSLGIGLQKITSDQLASLDALVTINVSLSKDSIKKMDNVSVSELASLNNVAMVSPSITQPAKATFSSSTAQVLAQGIKAEALSFEGVSLLAGQYFGEGNDGIVISKAAAQNFEIKDYGNIIGKEIEINIVVMPEDSTNLMDFKNVELKETVVGISNDELISSVYIPLEKLKDITKASNYSTLKVKVADRKKVETVRDQIEGLGFMTTSVVDLINQVDRVFLITQIILGIIGGVALVVALIGIINIMTISLLERTHEVGIMKAVGATDKDIKRIFEYEVFLFGLTGALAGVFSAWLFGSFINFLIHYLMIASNITGSLTVFVSPLYFIIQMVVLTVLVSLLAGWYPAKRASKLSPMEALRYE